MRIPGVKTAKKISKWIQGRLLGGALILGYHRVVCTENDPYEICVTPAHFAEHMQILRKVARPLRLSELVQHLEQGSLPPKSVAVTFDDGYIDNLQNARPILEQYQIPATVFISTDYLGKEFWWDELYRLIMTPAALPRTLRLSINGAPFEWNANDPEGKANERASETVREKLNDSLYMRLSPLEKAERAGIICQVKEWSGTQEPKNPANRAMTVAEVTTLASDRLIDIGAHTVTHPVLSQLPAAQQRDEIHQSKEILEALLAKPVPGFAYPNGKFSEETQAVVKAAGFLYACGSHQELIRQPGQRYALPRFWPKDIDGDRFARGLKLWLGN